MEIRLINSKIQELIDRQETETKLPLLLPSMHSTDCIVGEKVLDANELTVMKCPVFNEPLLYFFYGKPVYKVSAKHKIPRTDYLLSPCCFLLDSKKITAKYIYPFDTGAYKSGIYGDTIPSEMDIDSFQLKPDPTEIPEFIRTFFENNSNYLQGISTISDDQLNNAVTISLGSILRSQGVLPFDDRAKTVEIISACNVKLSEAAMAIIAPMPFLRNESFQCFTKAHPEIDVLTYFTHYPTDPYSHNEVIYQKAIEYLTQKEGML